MEADMRGEIRLDGGLISWGLRDPFVSPRLALRMQHDFPHARVEAVPGSRAFLPEDRPMLLAQLIEEFLGASIVGPGDGR